MTFPTTSRPYNPTPAQVVTTTRIILFSLVAGLVIFLAIIQFGMPAPGKLPGAMTFLPYAALGFFVVCGALSLILPQAMTTQVVAELARQKTADVANARDRAARKEVEAKFDPTVRLLVLYQTTTIIAAALREGPGMFAIIAYMMSRSYIALAVLGLSIAALAMLIPTADRLENWLADQTARIDQAGSGGF